MRQRRMIQRLLAFCVSLLLLFPGVLPHTSFAESSGPGVEMEIDLSVKGLRIGVSAGSVQEKLVRELYPDADIRYYEKVDGCTALALGKIDCYVYDKKQLEITAANGLAGIRVLDQTVGKGFDIALGISAASEIPELADQVDEFISASRRDGILDEMYDRWVIQGSREMPDLTLPSSPACHLTVGTTAVVEPYSFYAGTELTGYDIELARRLAAWMDADLSFEIYDYASIVEAARTGKVDLIAANLQVTPERAEALRFSEPVYHELSGIAVRDPGSVQQNSSDSSVHWQDYNGKRIGVLTGTLMEGIAKTFLPDSDYLYFNSYPDCNAALLAGRIDAYLGDEPVLKMIHGEQPQISYIPERLTTNEYSFAFRKNDPKSAALCEELNAFLAKSWEDGTIQEIDGIWFGTDEDRKYVEMSDLTGENGTIRVITTSTDIPFSYIRDGKPVGYDIDVIVRFCREKGYALELGDVDFGARIPAVQSGKYDFTTDMNVTPERQEEVLFSDPVSRGGVVLAVLTENLTSEPATDRESFFSSLKSSFEKTFIRENRYRLFLDGTGTTLLITVLSILVGTILGFAAYMACRNGNPLANALTRFLVWLVEGMPAVVLLMVLYYIIFARSHINGTAVAVIGFTLVFGAAVFGMLCSGTGAIDRGQTEAAYALGYGRTRTFFRIILPQAVPHFLPAYKSEITALIKATAIVGYIAVQDLTKMADIVRGRTYEAFFPLIAVAVIYFVLAGLLTFLVSRIEIRVDPKRRKKEDILKGVKTDD